MSYPWHMAFSGILVDTALEFRTSMHSLSLLYHSFWIFQPVSLVNNWFSISLHDQRCHPVCHDHMEQARGWPTRKLPPTNLSNAQKTNVSLRLIPVAIVIFRYVLVCHAVHCQNIGGERPLWRIVSFQCWESQLIIIPFLELQICFCLLSLCMASGSLIFFTFDINLTYLVCNGQEELFRYYPTKIISIGIKDQLTLMTMSLGENLHCSRR